MKKIMTREEKQLLIKDLCARLPYGVILSVDNGKYREDKKIWPGLFNSDDLWDAKPYLRPMFSMTEKELKELNDKYGNIAYFFIQDPPYYYGLQAQHEDIGSIEISEFSEIYDWLDAHYFDYRVVPSTGKTLIESGLALEALKEMYKTE